MKREIQIKTKRMILRPMQPEALESLIPTLPEALVQPYSEMLSGCREHPEAMLWYTPWQMILKETGKPVGDLCFKGIPQKGRVEIGYGIDSSYEGQGLTTEAAKALCDWAFSQQGVYIIEAETEADNLASQRVLEKAGFKPTDEMGEEGPRFALAKSLPSWIAIYMCLGMSVGLSLGGASGNSSLGMSMGISVGLCLGAALDASERKRRKAVCGE